MRIGTVVLYDTLCGTVIGAANEKLTLATSDGTIISVPTSKCTVVADADTILNSIGDTICRLVP